MDIENPVIHVAAGDLLNSGLPVVIGVPFPRGTVRDAAALAVAGPGGDERPLAARTLVPWGDGSVRWALLAFAAGSRGSHRVRIGRTGPAQAVSGPVQIVRAGQDLTVDNGLVGLTLAAGGPGPLRELTAAGHPYLPRPESMRLRVNAADSHYERSRTIRVLESSPLRARIRAEGAHFDAAGQRLLHYRFDA